MQDDDPIRILKQETLSDDYCALKKVTFRQRRRDGSERKETREVYANHGGTAVLLYNRDKGTVLLTRQFRIGAHLAGRDGFTIEVPAGNLGDADPAEQGRAELCEETGFRGHGLRKVIEFLPNPSSLTENGALLPGRIRGARPQGYRGRQGRGRRGHRSDRDGRHGGLQAGEGRRHQ